MPARISPELLDACPRIARMARVLCVVLALLGVLTAVAASLVGHRWDESLLQVSWVLVGAGVIAFLVMLAALWLGAQAPQQESGH
jgi:uncharacterized membrane protein